MTEGQEFIYRGRLSETSLPEILATIHRYRVPGVMELSRSEVTKHIFILDGDIIFATSTDRAESLGDHLLREGKITKAQYKVSSDELQRSPGKRHGSILVEMGFLASEDLGPAVREQVQQILWSTMDWTAGDVSFSVGRLRADEVFKIKIPTPRAILSGCKRISDARRLTGLLGGRQTVFGRFSVPEHLMDLRMESTERQLLELVDGKKTFLELCEQGPYAPGVNARVIYAFSVLQLISKDRPGANAIRIQVRTSEGSG